MSKVVVVDYGMGNVTSVLRVVEKVGGTAKLSDDPDVIRSADRVILPGVGAFEHGMEELCQRKLDHALRDYSETGRPLLGICLGMQMLMSYSEEFGFHKGLNILPGKVEKIPSRGSDEELVKTPHIGWNTLIRPEECSGWENTILNNVSENSWVYFVHSFTVVPENPKLRLANCIYSGCLVSAVIHYKSIFGCQFHPEKSGSVGLSIIKNFVLSQAN
jgi:imidazole glycerol-phosphate synthase subunit HisH